MLCIEGRTCFHKCNKGPRHRCSPCPAVRLKNITVNMDGPLTECLHIDHRAQGTPDEALNLLCSSRLPAAHSLPCRPLCPRSGEHGVLRRDPPCPRAFQKERYTLLYRCCAYNARMPSLNKGRAGRIPLISALDVHGAQLIGTSQISSWHAFPSSVIHL